MEDLLSRYDFLKLEFIAAIDGRIMSQEEISSKFDIDEAYRRYGRRLNGGEIGCTLSHFKCYEKIMDSSESVALILEDDISIMRNLSKLDLSRIDKILSTDEPCILFLSGDYWYWNKGAITNVFSAVGSYAYFINKPAAYKISQAISRPSNVADDWHAYKRLGIKLRAVYPYAIDANIIDLPSEINQEYWGYHRNKISIKYFISSCIIGLVKKLLICLGHFESKKR